MTNEETRFYKAFGAKLAKARRAARPKITQDALGAILGLSRTSITNIEKGRQPVQIHQLTKIAEVLRTNAIDLFPPADTHIEPRAETRLKEMEPNKRDWVERIIRTRTFRETGEETWRPDTT